MWGASRFVRRSRLPVSGLPEAQQSDSVSVLGTRSSLNRWMSGGGQTGVFAGMGLFQAAELLSTEPSTISVWKFNELETAALPVNARRPFPL